MKESRHRIILQELDQTGVVAVKNLKEMLGVTDMTIRRDLIDLENPISTKNTKKEKLAGHADPRSWRSP